MKSLRKHLNSNTALGGIIVALILSPAAIGASGVAQTGFQGMAFLPDTPAESEACTAIRELIADQAEELSAGAFLALQQGAREACSDTAVAGLDGRPGAGPTPLFADGGGNDGGNVNSVAIGPGAFTPTQNAVALGENAIASQRGGIAIGSGAQAIGPSAFNDIFATVAVGFNALASDNAVAIGNRAVGRFSGSATPFASGVNSAVALGAAAVAVGANTVAIGTTARAGTGFTINLPGTQVDAGNNITVIGGRAEANQNDATAIGANSEISAALGTALGSQTAVRQAGGIAIGFGAAAEGPSAANPIFASIAIGHLALAVDNATAIGNNAIARFSGTANPPATGVNSSTVVGANAVSVGANNVAIGTTARAGTGFNLGSPGDPVNAGGNQTVMGGRAEANQIDATAIGAFTRVSGESGTALGSGATVTATGGLALGFGSSATAANAVAIGAGALANAANTVSFGTVGGERRLVNVAAGIGATDGVNVAQLNAAVGGIAASGLISGVNTDALANALATGTRSLAAGHGSTATADRSSAFGYGASATGANSVAIGAGSIALLANTVSFGTPGNERRLVNVAAGVNPTDAANVGQLNATNTNVTNLTTTVTNQGNRLTTVEGTVATHTTQIANLGGRVTVVEGQIGSVLAIAPQVATLNTNVANLQTLTTSNTNRIGALETGFAGLQTNFTQLNADVNRLREDMNEGLAMATSLDILMPSGPGKTTVRAGYGYFGGESAVGLTLAHRANTDFPLYFDIGVSRGNSETLFRAGVGFEF